MTDFLTSLVMSDSSESLLCFLTKQGSHNHAVSVGMCLSLMSSHSHFVTCGLFSIQLDRAGEIVKAV